MLSFCRTYIGNLFVDDHADLRRFSLNVTRNFSQPYDIYYWGNSQSNLVISVDWTIDGMTENSIYVMKNFR